MAVANVWRVCNEMGKSVDIGSYVRDIPDTWEEHTSFHQYMKMYCNFTVQQSIEWAKQHLGPHPAKVTVNRTEIIPDDDDLDT